MRECLKAKEINKEIRRELPVIDKVTFKEHFCMECPYYAGKVDKMARCMQKQCAWDDESETFSPALRKMIPLIEEEYEKAEQHFLEMKRQRAVLYKMFEKELYMERKMKDPCYNCSYGKNAPCIGFCYKQMTSKPVDPFDGKII